jgi:hypothetical protein
MKGTPWHDDAAAYRQLDEFLWQEWDPLGVNNFHEARNEYDVYLPEIFRLLREGATIAEIATHLHHVVTHQMGLNCPFEEQICVAHKLHDLIAPQNH